MNPVKTKKNIFIFFLGIFAITTLIIISASNTVRANELLLQDDSLLVAFDTNTGAIILMERKSTRWILERRTELGVSFRMHVPLPNRRFNFVVGQKQHAVVVEQVSKSEVRLQWKNMESENGGTLSITLTANVTLKDGELTFRTSVENDTPVTIETIDYPYFGDLSAPGRNDKMHVRTMFYRNLGSVEINPQFNNSKGYWGDFVPTKTFDSFKSLFCLNQGPTQGLYDEIQDPTQPYLLEYTFEQHPGVIQSNDNSIPQEDKISGIPVHLVFRTCHFIFAQPNSKKQLVPVKLRCYSGDWHKGVDIYKQWRASWIKPAHKPGWINDVNSWLQLQINSPEQDYRVSYKNLLMYGEECAANGVNAIQLVGWNRGGQDGEDPNQDTDPGLGTKEQLKDAITKIQKMGVRIILFGKINWADKTTDWYKKELHKYEATDPYGIAYEQRGYSYYTPTQLSGIINRRRAVMDFLCPAYQSAITKEFQKALEFGASGWLFDENCHHGGVKYSFASNHGYVAHGFIYSGDMPQAAQLHKAADKVNPDFLFAGEEHQDWQMQYYHCSYFRKNDGSTAVDRYIDSQAPLMVAVTGFDDWEKLNLILMDSYIIGYEPYNINGHVTDYPLTLAYGKKIDDLRRKYKSYLWDADFRDTQGADIIANGSYRYSVFLTNTGKLAVVVVNKEFDKLITDQVKMPHQGQLAAASKEQPEAWPFRVKYRFRHALRSL